MLDELLPKIVVRQFQLLMTYSWLSTRMSPYTAFLKDERLVLNFLPHSFHFIKTYIPSVYQWLEDMSKGTMLPWCSKSITQNDFSYISPPRPHLCHLFFSLSFSTIISQQVSSYGDGDSQLNHNIAKASNIFHIFFIYMFFINVQTTMQYKSAYPQYFYF